MALKPLDIFKYLPKTNCKECGFPTCLAFAMQLALGKTELVRCPHLSEEGKNQLAQASAPPIRTVTVGTGDNQIKLGGETVLFRHEKTFYNPPALGVLISERMSDEEITTRLADIGRLSYERVGLKLQAELIAVEDTGQGRFSSLVEKACATGKCLLLMSQEVARLREAVKGCLQSRPLLFAADSTNWEQMGNLAREFSLPLVVRGASLETLVELAGKLSGPGLADLVLYPEVSSGRELLEKLVTI
ncbi:MAG TPA: (Fe-S)-binding protein, partial [bacterium]|nr:(Fe-S)-binding protein [bacterium]